MKLRLLVASGLAVALTAGSAFAAGGKGKEAADVLDATITLLPEGAELPDVVTAAIELPKNDAGEYIPNEHAVERSAKGLDTANLARENGRAFGEAAAAAAREHREDVTRGSKPDLADLLPDQARAPDVPASPDRPAPPDHPSPPDHPTPPTP